MWQLIGTVARLDEDIAYVDVSMGDWIPAWHWCSGISVASTILKKQACFNEIAENMPNQIFLHLLKVLVIFSQAALVVEA